MHVRLTHTGASRDSLLMPLDDRTIGFLLQFKIQLVRWEPSDRHNVSGTFATGDGVLHDQYGRFHLDRWTDAEWDGFRSNFVGVVTRHWDDKFALLPNQAWFPARGPNGTTDARVNCNLSIALVETAAAAHHRYFIIKPQETTFRSFADPPRRLGLFTHRDLALSWNSRLTRVGHHRHHVDYLQSTVLHEFGHTLGLDHVNGAGNNEVNYGVTLDQREDLMGMGDHLTTRHARPWKSQLSHHLIHDHARSDATLRFSAEVTAPQLITYWDNDWNQP